MQAGRGIPELTISNPLLTPAVPAPLGGKSGLQEWLFAPTWELRAQEKWVDAYLEISLTGFGLLWEDFPS